MLFKSEAILFGFKQKNRNIDPPSFEGVKIDWKNEVKYLGVILDRKLKFHKHIDSVKNKASGAINRLYPILKTHSHLSYKNGVLIYKMLIRPILTYAPAIWGGASKSQLEKLQRVQNRVLRLITNAPRYTRTDRLHKDLNVESIREFTRKLSIDFYSKCAKSNYNLINGLGRYDYDPFLKHSRPKDFLSK